MRQKLKAFNSSRTTLVMKLSGLAFLVFMAAACKSVPDDVSMDEHLTNLMNNRRYDEVIATIDTMPKNEQNKPEYILYRAEAFCGKSGFDLVTLTKSSTEALNFKAVEDSFARLLKSDGTGGAASATSANSKIQINIIKSFISFAGYLRAVESMPQVSDQARPLLMESLLTLQRIPPGDNVFYRKAKTQSFLLHTVIFLSSVKKSIRSNAPTSDSADIFCSIDPSTLIAEYPTMSDHLNGALEDADVVKKILEGATYKPGQLATVRAKIANFNSDKSASSPGSLSTAMITAQGLQCGP
jgi:hypothetical protein